MWGKPLQNYVIFFSCGWNSLKTDSHIVQNRKMYDLIVGKCINCSLYMSFLLVFSVQMALSPCSFLCPFSVTSLSHLCLQFSHAIEFGHWSLFEICCNVALKSNPRWAIQCVSASAGARCFSRIAMTARLCRFACRRTWLKTILAEWFSGGRLAGPRWYLSKSRCKVTTISRLHVNNVE